MVCVKDHARAPPCLTSLLLTQSAVLGRSPRSPGFALRPQPPCPWSPSFVLCRVPLCVGITLARRRASSHWRDTHKQTHVRVCKPTTIEVRLARLKSQKADQKSHDQKADQNVQKILPKKFHLCLLHRLVQNRQYVVGSDADELLDEGAHLLPTVQHSWPADLNRPLVALVQQVQQLAEQVDALPEIRRRLDEFYQLGNAVGKTVVCLHYECVYMCELWCSDCYIMPRLRIWRFVSSQCQR